MNDAPHPIAFCTRYTPLGASSRLRFYAYLEAVRQAGFAVRCDAFFSDGYLRRLYAGCGKSRLRAAWSLFARLLRAPFWPHDLVIEYELFPELSYEFEARWLKNRRYVLNFDDNVWEKYNHRPRLRGKYDDLVRHAAGVIVANEFLREKVAPLNANVLEIPTVVELARYRERPPRPARLTLLWVGTPVTYVYLEAFADTLRAMAAHCDFELLVLARKSLESRRIPGVAMRFLDWDEASEAREIARAHIGIMPLTDDPFSRGKSAYKLIQCLAAGLPVIASPVGENRRVVTPDCGFLAATPAAWCEALSVLADPARRAHFAAAAVHRAAAYSLEHYRKIYVEFLRLCFPADQNTPRN